MKIIATILKVLELLGWLKDYFTEKRIRQDEGRRADEKLEKEAGDLVDIMRSADGSKVRRDDPDLFTEEPRLPDR